MEASVVDMEVSVVDMEGLVVDMEVPVAHLAGTGARPPKARTTAVRTTPSSLGTQWPPSSGSLATAPRSAQSAP